MQNKGPTELEPTRSGKPGIDFHLRLRGVYIDKSYESYSTARGNDSALHILV